LILEIGELIALPQTLIWIWEGKNGTRTGEEGKRKEGKGTGTEKGKGEGGNGKREGREEVGGSVSHTYWELDPTG